MKKYIIFFLLPFIFGCPTPHEELCLNEYEVVGVGSEFYKMLNETAYESMLELTDEDDTIKYNLLIVNVHTIDSIIGLKQSCNWQKDSTRGELSEILIKSNNKYSENYNREDILNDIFMLNYIETTYMHSDSLISIQDFLKNNQKGIFSVNLYTVIPTDSIRLHQFTIKFKFKDGREFETVTNPIYIKP